MTAVILITITFVAGLVWFMVWAVRRSRAIQVERSRARIEYLRRRAEFLATASPVEAQAFLIEEQTNALIEAQARNTNVLAMMLWLNGSNSPFGRHGRDG
jgi:hypothetical protein